MRDINILTLTVPEFYPKQEEFMKSRVRYTAYGGARGGGKSFAARWKAVLLANRYNGIQILLLRRTLPELRENHLIPLQKILNTNSKDKNLRLAEYKEVTKEFIFPNESRIKLGYCDSENDVLQYQGQAYDVILLEEATHFCVTPDTEVMTDSGWKYIEDVRKTDKVYSSTLDGVGKYKEVDTVWCFQHKGVIYKYESRNSINFAVTEGHTLLTDKGLVPIEDISYNHKVLVNPKTRIEPERVEYYEDFTHIKGGHNEIDKVEMDIWLRFLGWYLSEGCAFERDGKSPRISIRQMKYNSDLVYMLDNLGYRYNVSEDGQYRIYSRQLYNIVHPLGDTYTKRVPRYVFSLPTEQIEIFLNSFCEGDGHVDKNGNANYGLANEGLIDDLQELYTLIGKVSTKGKSNIKDKYVAHRLTVRGRTNNAYINKKNLTQEDYEGDVWCLTVRDNHNFMTRRNGRIMITGNTEFQYQTLTESNRPSGLITGDTFSPRMYLTCNPGGVGHQWVKRLFIDRQYRRSEEKEDYEFIPSLVYENKWLMENDPEYIKILENLPENRRKAMLYGNWDVYDGQFFDEFDREVHVIEPKKLSNNYKVYRVLDYGLDMTAAYHIAVTSDKNMFVLHEIYESDLIVSEACAKIKETTKNLGYSESDISLTLAPVDLWSRDSSSGKSAADIFYDNGVILTKVSQNRVDGWLALKELLKIYDTRDSLTGDPVKTSRLKIFSTCPNLIRCIPLLQHDSNKVNDVSTTPHEITHAPDALRYFAVYWITEPIKEEIIAESTIEWTQDMLDDYYAGNDDIKERMIEKYGTIN